jgi:hypothetical protein
MDGWELGNEERILSSCLVALANVTAVVAVASVDPLIWCHVMRGEGVRLAFHHAKGLYIFTVGYWPNPKFSFPFSFPCCLMVLNFFILFFVTLTFFYGQLIGYNYSRSLIIFF